MEKFFVMLLLVFIAAKESDRECFTELIRKNHTCLDRSGDRGKLTTCQVSDICSQDSKRIAVSMRVKKLKRLRYICIVCYSNDPCSSQRNKTGKFVELKCFFR
ncbi:hypothetical protein GJ496_002299 [Pomphorhynchus laevis]|nr:hypothetical protein GJ496_002299 [Pomphorhynchus laevis]